MSWVTYNAPGGAGGGGQGSHVNAQSSTSGSANTGGGGGGQDAYSTGSGGSGIVIIAYPDSFRDLTIGSGLTYTQPSRSGYKVYRFTAGTGNVSW
jgi:hypothetical protein